VFKNDLGSSTTTLAADPANEVEVDFSARDFSMLDDLSNRSTTEDCDDLTDLSIR
jgi:hypothetical protein